MATGLIGQGQITQAVNTINERAVRFGEHKGVYKGTVTVKKMRNGTRTYDEPALPPLTPVAVAADDEFDAPQQISDQKITITPSEIILQILMSRRANLTSSLSLQSDLAQLVSDGIEFKRDADGLAIYDTAGGSLGSGTATFTVDLGAKALAGVRAGLPLAGATARTGARETGDPAPGPYWIVLHEYNRFDLMAQLSGLSGAPTQVTTGAAVMNWAGSNISEFNKRMIQEGNYAGDVAGAGFLVDSNLSISSSAVKGAAYSQDALIHVTFVDYDMEEGAVIDTRFRRFQSTADYGNGIRRPVGIVELHVDATTPA